MTDQPALLQQEHFIGHTFKDSLVMARNNNQSIAFLFRLPFPNLVSSDPAHGLTGPKKIKPLPQFVKESEMDELLNGSMWNLSDYKDVCARTIIMAF